MDRIITLKDISIATGVSLASVHRAIHHKEGISSELRKIILEKAEQLGYKTNYAASSLKRRAVEIAILLPTSEDTGQYYYKYFWDACRAYRTEITGLNVHITEFAFSGEGESQLKILQQIYEQHGHCLDGLLTVPLTKDKEMRDIVEKFIEKGISVVLVDNDIPDTRRLCCISPHDTSTGRLGAEFLSAITPSAGKVLVSAGNESNSSHIHNACGFSAYLTENSIPLEVHKIYGYENPRQIYHEAKAFFEQERDVVAFYSVTARETIPLCQAVIDTKRNGQLRGVGSDLFPMSVQMLQANVVQALIYKNPYEKAYLGFKILFELIIRKAGPESPTTTVPISLVMKNNLHFFQKFI